MRTAHITRRQAEALADVMDADVSAVQEHAVLSFERAEIESDEHLDHLAQDVDMELTADEHEAMLRFLHDFTDCQSAHRTRRRAGREVLRSLPGQIVPSAAAEIEAA
jgi:hypothetical protein